MPYKTSGADSPSAIQNRRVMSASSGFGGSSSDTVSGSRAMPHFGHVPGLSLVMPAHIGHT